MVAGGAVMMIYCSSGTATKAILCLENSIESPLTALLFFNEEII